MCELQVYLGCTFVGIFAGLTNRKTAFRAFWAIALLARVGTMWLPGKHDAFNRGRLLPDARIFFVTEDAHKRISSVGVIADTVLSAVPSPTSTFESSKS